MDTTTPSPAFPPALARIVATVSIGFVVTQLDVTIVNIALAHLAADLHLPVAGLQWVVDAYTLAFAVLMLSAGALGDRFGTRRLYVAGLLLFAFASLACGAAVAPAMLIAARALQGVGAAAMLPNSLALLNDACRHDPRLRARAVGGWTAAGSIAIAAGPVVGGLLIAAWGWRGIFLVNLPLCAAGLAATFAWVPARRAQAAPARSARSLDPRGQFIAIAMLTALTGAVIEWRPLGFTHPVVAGGFVLAALAALAFVAVESRTATPMLPLSLFRHPAFSAAVLFGICVNLTYYGTVFVLALYLQRARGESALQAGLAFLPLTGGFLLSNLASGRVVARHGPRVPMVAGALVAALGYGSLHFVDAATPLGVLLVPFLLVPSGMGFAVPAMTTAVLASVAPERAGIVSAVLNTARQAGGAIGVAAFGALASDGGAAQVVSGLRIETVVSVALLVAAALLATRVRTDANRGAPRSRQALSAHD
ncbi:MFS transporter [Burkholderia cenocepacia]|uniref:MFS transporter n=1 Tax=Burkholderia cenocepacia TaxID=95486 RepID=UPI002AB7058A|nr:MFS transporter [Burkholderia cenocepacia]